LLCPINDGDLSPGARPSDNDLRVRCEPDYFRDEDLHLVYVARRLEEAQELERVLTERSVDYLVEPDTYAGGIIFRRARVGAFFYVREADLECVRAVMQDNGYRPCQP